jgi:hypothetical protein
MNGTDVPVRGQSRDSDAPHFIMQDSYRLYCTINGLRYNNIIVAYDTQLGYVTYLVEFCGPCDHCGFAHDQVREETSTGLVRVWRA